MQSVYVPPEFDDYVREVADAWMVLPQQIYRDAIVAALDAPVNWTPRPINERLVPPGQTARRRVRIFLPERLRGRVDDLAQARMMDLATMTRVLILIGLQRVIDQEHLAPPATEHKKEKKEKIAV
jgi:hypothetical protein